ncbi:BaiN/RdsA family NAD(P)/FAD-dependent oxidoreductase [Gluconobacter wancherniae]|uniref:NAD(P)/FAD-dependent oxidoreductase n=1 Tax=Gluconobacter wancherniae TaxID=1307955 RepID=UPI001B8B77EE|nr:aminoacetone oxidase family FAD-binding enzyme [Gluconobacter wancherniae]MBS1089232.1 aminoacetone oxidase family FAD-binding enzyme [Gluconobacter wancherniae]
MIWDVVVLGAGAAGLMAAATAGQGGARVLVLDHGPEPGRKILISGGGRCNFTHMDTSPNCFLSQNRHFARSALARYTPKNFLELVERHRIAWHEKAKGQLFCDGSARQIVEMLVSEAHDAGCTLWMDTRITDVEREGEEFRVVTDHAQIRTRKVILATGGLSIPKLGASDLSLRLAKRFGLKLVETAPALVPLILADADPSLAGVSLNVAARGHGKAARFEDGMVFTHRGLSGPAILQASSYMEAGKPVEIDLLPGRDVFQMLLDIKKARPKALPPSLLEALPSRLAKELASDLGDVMLANQPDRQLKALAERVSRWTFLPAGTEGYAKAEVMRGGIDTRGLSSQTMEARDVPGLYAIGEAVDVTGWLGGHNFQWAWASGVAAGKAAAGVV